MGKFAALRVMKDFEARVNQMRGVKFFVVAMKNGATKEQFETMLHQASLLGFEMVNKLDGHREVRSITLKKPAAKNCNHCLLTNMAGVATVDFAGYMV